MPTVRRGQPPEGSRVPWRYAHGRLSYHHAAVDTASTTWAIAAALGNRIRQRRTVLRLRQEPLAHDAGLHRTVVGTIVREERDFGVSKPWPLAEALTVSMTDCFADRANDSGCK
jgi:hypothetical protein